MLLSRCSGPHFAPHFANRATATLLSQRLRLDLWTMKFRNNEVFMTTPFFCRNHLNAASFNNPKWRTGYRYWLMMRKAGRSREKGERNRAGCSGCGKQQGRIPQMRKQLTLREVAGWFIWRDRRGTGGPQKMRAVFVTSQCHVGSGRAAQVKGQGSGNHWRELESHVNQQ